MTIDVTSIGEAPRVGAVLIGERLPPAFRWRFRRSINVTFRKCYFDSTVFEAWLGTIEFVGCVFQECEFEGIKGCKVRFEDCSFVQCSVGKQYVSNLEKCVFVRVKFVGCIISELSIVSSNISESIFDGQFSRFRLEKCSVDSVSFVGWLVTGWLHYNTYSNADMTGMRIEDLSLLGSSLLGLRLPDERNAFFMSALALRKILSSQNFGLKAVSFQSLQNMIRDELDTERGDFVERCIFEDFLEAEQDLIMKELYRISHE